MTDSNQSRIEHWLLAGKTLTQPQCTAMRMGIRLASCVQRMKAKGYRVLMNPIGQSRYAMYYVPKASRR